MYEAKNTNKSKEKKVIVQDFEEDKDDASSSENEGEKEKPIKLRKKYKDWKQKRKQIVSSILKCEQFRKNLFWFNSICANLLYIYF